LERLKKWNGDVVISDLVLTDSRGIDTFKAIQEALPKYIPIVLLSRSEDEREALEAVSLGAQDYLVKGILNKNNLSRVLHYASQRRKSQEEIYIAEEKYRTIFDNSAVAILLTDNENKIISWNKFAEKMLGLSDKELYLKKLDLVYPKEEWEKIEKWTQKQGEVKEHFETKIVRREREWVDVDISMSVLKNTDGMTTGYIVIMQDITERKNLEHAKDEFISTVSHELRTPMTIVREGISQVYEGLLGPTTGDQNQILSITLESIDRLARMINDLLDISRLEAGKMQLNKGIIDLVVVSKIVQTSFSTIAKERGLKIELDTSKNVIEVHADQDKIIQVLTNLLGNAFKFTKIGSIKISLDEKDGEVLCSVTDSGRGMSEKQLGKIFDKFQQFGREVGPGDKGAGLGLSISKKLMDLHGGRIWATSEMGVGSTFVFSLPKTD